MSEQIEIHVENIETEATPTIGVALNPELIKRFTANDVTEAYTWAYNKGVFDSLNILVEGAKVLLNDEVVSNNERSIAFALGFKAAFTLLNETHEKMDQSDFRETAQQFFQQSGIE